MGRQDDDITIETLGTADEIHAVARCQGTSDYLRQYMNKGAMADHVDALVALVARLLDQRECLRDGVAPPPDWPAPHPATPTKETD